ncbi:MAG: HD domain-containing protein [Turicibacter sp.]|nr:HD domain-containing protein [Turicibacter sp.]
MEQIYPQLITFLEQELGADNSGHSLDHAIRVYNNARIISNIEGGNQRIILMSALVHDVIDPKLFLNPKEQQEKLLTFLESLGCSERELREINYVIENISFKGGHGQVAQTLELKIVQDADRLDAIGAIGIGRTFMYGGAKGSKMYDEAILPIEFENEEAYRRHKGTVINHFYEKLFKLKDLMNTPTARQLAQKRHDLMVHFVEEFLKEWRGEID